MTFFEITDADRALIAAALDALLRNFDDGIYHHTVGAAIRTKSGKVYSGVNCAGVHGACAEYVVMGMAVSAGEREFDTIVAAHEKMPGSVISPCGNCRQMLFEYCPDIKVILCGDDGKLIKVGIRDLLPFAWKPVIVEEETAVPGTEENGSSSLFE